MQLLLKEVICFFKTSPSEDSIVGFLLIASHILVTNPCTWLHMAHLKSVFLISDFFSQLESKFAFPTFHRYPFQRAPWAAAEAEEPVVPRTTAGAQSARSARSAASDRLSAHSNVTSGDRLSAHSNVTSSDRLSTSNVTSGDRLSTHSNVTSSDRLSAHSNGTPARSVSPASSTSSEAPRPAGRQRTATMRLARRPREQRFGLQLEAKKGTVLVQKVTRGESNAHKSTMPLQKCLQS